MYNTLSASVLNCNSLKQMFISTCNRKDLSLLLSSLNKLSNTILRVLITTVLTASNTSCTVFIFSLLLKEEDFNQSSDMKMIAADNTSNIYQKVMLKV